MYKWKFQPKSKSRWSSDDNNKWT